MRITRAVNTKTLKGVPGGKIQLRQLHLTDPSGLPARIASVDQSRLRVTQDIESLKRECRRRGISSNGSKPELAARLGYPSARLFSTSDSGYDSFHIIETTSSSSDKISFQRAITPKAFSPTNHSRHFNTSGNLKAARDSSTIDFAHLPIFPAPASEEQPDDIRVPLLPQNSRVDGAKAPMASEIEELGDTPVQIFVVSAESTHLEGGPSMMTETHDSPKEFDFQGVAKQVALGIERENDEDVRKSKGLFKQVWTGFVDDLFGSKQSKS